MYSLLEPVQLDFDFQSAYDFGYLVGQMSLHTSDMQPDISDADIVILGIKEDRNALNNEGANLAPDAIRKVLYKLFPGKWHKKIADIGNLRIGDTYEATYRNLLSFLQHIRPFQRLIILGGTQEITAVLTKYFDLNNKAYSLSVIDSVIDGTIIDSEPDNENYLTSILTNDNSLLRNLSIIGLQTYFNHPSKFDIFDKLFVDYYKLGDIQANISEAEPEIRAAELLSVDVRSIKFSDMPAQVQARTNGFTGQEMCAMTRFAGLSVINKCLGIFEYNPFYDTKEAGAMQIAQMIWYYIEGVNLTKIDYPQLPEDELMKFHVQNDLIKLVFYKNKKTGRWWVALPDVTHSKELFACSESDYQSAVDMKLSKRIYKIINKASV